MSKNQKGITIIKKNKKRQQISNSNTQSNKITSMIMTFNNHKDISFQNNQEK